MNDQDLRAPLHNGHLMAAGLRRHRNRPVLHLGDTVLSGAEVEDRISQYTQAFAAVGARPSALLSPNRPEVLFVLGAGQVSGLRRTALHPLGSADDHAYVINDAGIDTLIIDPAFTDHALVLWEKCPGLKSILTIGPVPEAIDEVGQDLVALAAGFAPQPLEVAQLDPDHVISLTYTGGTTGRPKGVIGTAGSMHAMAQIQLAEWEWPQAPKFLMCTPLSHAGAAFFVPTVVRGGSLHVLPKFDPAEVLRTIEEERITATMLVPSMIYALLDHPDSRTRDLSSLETVYYGASAINPDRLAEAIERFGPVFAQYYGQSEAPMAISYLAKADHDPVNHPGRLASCGRPSAFVRLALLGPDGRQVPAGEPGEICVAGPLVSGGYWQLPEQTAEAFHGGWLHTGDVARQDAEGYLYIVDRLKDMVVTGGFNVFPREIEDVIATHPAVAEVAVVGVPHEKFGESVLAVVVPRSGSTFSHDVADEIVALVRERKGPVHAPKEVIAVPSLPLTGLGKPDKQALRARFGG